MNNRNCKGLWEPKYGRTPLFPLWPSQPSLLAVLSEDLELSHHPTSSLVFCLVLFLLCFAFVFLSQALILLP